MSEDAPAYTPVRKSYTSSGKATARSSKGSKASSRNSKGSRRGRRGSREQNVTVKSGDTLSKIAARNHTTVKNLQKLNKIKGNTIRKGAKIKVK